MPITEKQLSYREMQDIAKTNVCGQCGKELAIAWVGGEYCLRCPTLEHNTVKPKNRIPENLKSEVYKNMTTQMIKMDEAKMTVRVNQAKFPQQLKPEEKTILVRAALDYGLDPLMGELTIYQGKPFVSIDGRLRKAHETGGFEGIESRPATPEEREARGTLNGNKLWRSEVFKKGCTHGFVGWGEVRESEMKGNAFLPTVSWPDRMAEKRSQVMALRLAFYLPLPSFEDIGSADVIPEPPKDYSTEGQVVDAEVVKPMKRDSAGIKTVGDLFLACLEDFKLQPSDILKELNLKSKQDIADPAESYKVIAMAH